LKKGKGRARKICSLKDAIEEKGTYHALLLYICDHIFKAIAIVVVFKLSKLAIGV